MSVHSHLANIDTVPQPAENPQEAIALAESGSTNALMYISAEIRRQRNFRTIRVAQLFCNALSVTPPSLPTVICSDHVAEGAQSALVGLDALLREPSSVPTSEFAATILKSMPAVAVWAAYFATLPADRWPDGLGHRDVTLVKISWLIFRLLRVSESAKPKVVRTPGVVVLIASLWANEARTAANPAVYPPSTEMLLAVLQGNMSADGQLDDAILREVVATAGGGSVDEVARIAIIHVRSAGSAMAPLCASACALLELSRGDQNALRAAILDRGGVSIIAKELFKFARQDDGSDPSADHMVAACVKYILTVAETGRGLPWLRQMLEGNLLESLVKMSTRLARLEAPDQLLIANFLEDVLPRYLVYSSVVELAAKQFRKIHMAKLDSTPLRASWMALAKVLIPHARFYLALGVTKGTGCCTQCVKHLPNGQLKQCSRCRAAQYCSKECQTKNWAEHKTKCKIISVPLQHSLSIADKTYVTALTIREARLAAPRLRALAAERHTGVPLSDLGVRVDFDTVPPCAEVFDLATWGECTLHVHHTDHARHAFVEKLNEGHTLVQSVISHGEDSISPIVEVKDFWDEEGNARLCEAKYGTRPW